VCKNQTKSVAFSLSTYTFPEGESQLRLYLHAVRLKLYQPRQHRKATRQSHEDFLSGGGANGKNFLEKIFTKKSCSRIPDRHTAAPRFELSGLSEQFDPSVIPGFYKYFSNVH
jgi:hypothetical protein